MNEAKKHTVLCVDDEINILNSLKRLLRKEDYSLLTASSGREGLELLASHDVHLVMSDQRMPEMSGTEFLSEIKDQYPDVIRIILTGYTEVDAITESINRGHIYKFFLKPWNDENLKLEIQKALEQYDLIKANEELTRTIITQNQELKSMNDHLEETVKKRTRELTMRNQALELSQAILEHIPFPILGVSEENTVVLVNRMVEEVIWTKNGKIIIGDNLNEYVSENLMTLVKDVFADHKNRRIENHSISGTEYTIDISPLTGVYLGKGVILTLIKSTNAHPHVVDGH